MGNSKSVTCQIAAQTNLAGLSSTNAFGWCETNQVLTNLLTWFDNDRSFAYARWLSPAVWSMNQINSGQNIIFSAHSLSFLVASVIANCFVLMYHFSNPAHPKFSFTSYSRTIMRIHVTTGSIGVVAPLFVFFTTNQWMGRRIMFFFCLVDYIFAYTARIQAPNVTGVRNITIPIYNTCISLKAVFNTFLLWALLTSPVGGYKSQVERLWICWVHHQTYAWVRVWYLFFLSTEIMTAHQYTIAVMLAGFMCINYACGFLFVIVFLCLMVSHFHWVAAKSDAMFKVAEEEMQSDGKVSEVVFREAGMLSKMWEETVLDIFSSHPDAAENALKRCLDMNIDPMDPNVINNVSSATKAKFLFDTINTDGDEHITVEELSAFFMDFGVKDTTKAAIDVIKAADDSGNNLIELDEFEKHFSAFYNYAFNDLMRGIQNANRASLRNKLQDFAHKERMLRIKSIQHCPFAFLSQSTEGKMMK